MTPSPPSTGAEMWQTASESVMDQFSMEYAIRNVQAAVYTRAQEPAGSERGIPELGVGRSRHSRGQDGGPGKCRHDSNRPATSDTGTWTYSASECARITDTIWQGAPRRRGPQPAASRRTLRWVQDSAVRHRVRFGTSRGRFRTPEACIRTAYSGGLHTDCVLRWQLAGGGRHLRAAQSGECRKQCLISVSRAQFFQTAAASEPGDMCIGRSVASPPTAHLAPYTTIGSPASASMQCLHVGGFVLNCDRNLVHVDGADVPTSSLTIEWAFTHDAVDGAVKRSHGDGHVLHLAANGRHGPVAYIQKEQINGIWTINKTSHEDDCRVFVNLVPLHYGEVATIEIGGLIVIMSPEKTATFACLHLG